MCFKRSRILLFSLVFCAVTGMFFCGCEAMDSLLPSAGSYRVNVLANDVSLDDCSFISSGDVIRPLFEEPVSNDPDVTALMVFLRDSKGDITGKRVIYSFAHDDSFEDDHVIIVRSLDGNLPAFPLPENLHEGRFTLVSNVMGGKNILQRIEKQLFFLNKNKFSYEGINVYLPGVAESSHLIPKETLILLEAKLEFDSSLDPYIVWYDGRRKISEGRFSEGAGQHFWRAPEQSGFFALRAEVFPADNFNGLAGYQKGVSLLVSSMAIDIHLVSRNVPQLTYWYVLEGNLDDSSAASIAIESSDRLDRSIERALRTGTANAPVWKGADGTYGLVTDNSNSVSLPRIPLSNSFLENWQTLFRFMPINDGSFLTVQFGSLENTNIQLSIDDRNLVLTLTSPLETASQTYTLPQRRAGAERNSFYTAGISITVQSGSISANVNIIGNTLDSRSAARSVTVRANTSAFNDFLILLGNTQDDSAVLWDEFALYYMPPIEVLAAELNPVVRNENSQN
ncbi:MAG: hypothetical protein FWD28_05820 [Treponema sp.]|nr:hypothetical protein [Treponema sp.]